MAHRSQRKATRQWIRNTSSNAWGVFPSCCDSALALVSNTQPYQKTAQYIMNKGFQGRVGSTISGNEMRRTRTPVEKERVGSRRARDAISDQSRDYKVHCTRVETAKCRYLKQDVIARSQYSLIYYPPGTTDHNGYSVAAGRMCRHWRK